MTNLFAKLFHRKIKPPQFDIEKTVGHYLLTLPRCTSRVLLISRRFLDKRYNYELTVDTATFVDWAKRYEKGGSSSNDNERAACIALTLWLRGADLTDNSVSFPPKVFFDIWREHHSTFYEMSGNQVYCHECHQIVEEVLMQTTKLPPKEIFECERYEWHCPNGHLLYQEEVGRHFHRSRPELYGDEVLDIPSYMRKQGKDKKGIV